MVQRASASRLRQSRSARKGFTVIELMIVLAIVAILAGMLMSLLGIGRNAARRAESEGVLHKVDTALRHFKTDFKAYPFQRRYPDEFRGETWDNHLYRVVGTDMSDDDRVRVGADMDAAGALFAYSCSNPSGQPAERLPPASVHTFVTDRRNGRSRDWEWGGPEGDDAPTTSYYRASARRWFFGYEPSLAVCAMLNRMAAERARLLMLIGDVDACGVTMREIPGNGGLLHRGRDLSAVPLIPPQRRRSDPGIDHQAHAGWSVDYLQGELDPRLIDGERVLDAWRHPLVYLCQVLPGVQSSVAKPFASTVTVFAPEWYGLAPIGRKRLRHEATADAGLPDPRELMHSDATTWAAPGYELEFELWSAGPDGRFARMRDDPRNRDNLSAGPYVKGLRQ